MKFLLMTGLGDSVWAIFKIQAVRDKLDPGGKIDVSLVGTTSTIDSRALDFVRRFKFINSVEMRVYEIHHPAYYRPDGCYDYISDGIYEFDGDKYCVLIPNEPLERGVRLEDWLPQYAINWDIFKEFEFSDEEKAFGEQTKQTLGPYAVFYPGPLHGNTVDGHNRNALWKPTDWINLGRSINKEFGLEIVAVGAPYDLSYYQALISPLLNGTQQHWHSLIGMTNIGEVFSVTSHAKFVIGYQAGIPIISTYLGTPTGIFWRPRGDSISPNVFLSFDERMSFCWVPPQIIKAGTHMPLIYGKHDVEYIMSEISRRGWANA